MTRAAPSFARPGFVSGRAFLRSQKFYKNAGSFVPRAVRNKARKIFRLGNCAVNLNPKSERDDFHETSEYQMPLLRLPGAPASGLRGIRPQSRRSRGALLRLRPLSSLRFLRGRPQGYPPAYGHSGQQAAAP